MYICEICGTKFSSDFTDESEGSLAYRITHGFARIFGRWPMARARYVLLLFLVTQISQMTQIFLRGRVWSHRFHRYTQIFYGISGESFCPISGGICNDQTGRICEIPCRPMIKKICVTKKHPKKNLCISVKSVGQNFHRISRMNRKAGLLIGLLTDLRGYLAAGQWLAPDMCCYCFWSRRFRR